MQWEVDLISIKKGQTVSNIYRKKSDSFIWVVSSLTRAANVFACEIVSGSLVL